MPSETMSPRERWLAVLNRQKPDRVPMDYWATWETTVKLCAHLGCDDQEMVARLHIDRPIAVGGHYIGTPIPEGEDLFGVKRQRVVRDNHEECEVVNAPLAKFQSVEEIVDNYTWPNPDDWDYSHLPEFIKDKEHWPILGGGSEPFLQYKILRGEEQAFMDLIENPDIVHYCLEQLYEIAYQNTLRIFEAIPGKVLYSYVSEDLGSQSSLLYSPDQIRTFFKPHIQRMAELVHQNDAYVFHHSDGAIRDILPDMLEAGIDILNPIQWRCPGMERAELKQDFGAQVIFHGGVDNQYTLPFGSPDEVRQEVEDNLQLLGNDGGYILAPCHNLQEITPVENILALYETGYELGWT